MKFKDYLNSLVSKRKSTTSSTKSQQKATNTKNHQESTASADGHYDVCSYEDINGSVPDDQHSRTQVLLARHANLVNTIVGTRSPNDSTFSSCTQCRIPHQSLSMIPPPPPPSLPPPLPPKLSLEQHTSFSNRNYSSTLATCSPRRECFHQPFPYHQSHFISSQYSTPNPSVVSSSNSSLWTTTTSLCKKQRSRIRTNPWIGNTTSQNRSSAVVDTSCVFHDRVSPPVIQPEYGVYDPTYRTSPLGLIHSESFPQATSNGNIHLINPSTPVPPAPAPTSNVILHQSDSGHGFSLSSSRVIDSSSTSSTSSPSSSPSSHPSSSSSPDHTSGDGVLLNEKLKHRQKKLKKKVPSTSPPLLLKRSSKRNASPDKYFRGNTIASDSGSLTRRKKAHRISSPVTLQYRYQRPSEVTKTSPVKSPIDRKLHKHHSLSSSSHSIDDHFSLEFEEILENERSYKQHKNKQSSTAVVSPTSARKSAFILPLDDTSLKLSSPPPIVFTSTLVKTNSRAILKHIEEIENEIRLIKNLDLADDDDDNDEFVLSPHAYPEEDLDLNEDTRDNLEEDTPDRRQSIYEQVNQWVNTCLKPSNPSAILQTECDHLSNTIEGDVHINADQPTSPSSLEKTITFDFGSTSNLKTKRTSSFIDQPSKLQPTTYHLKSAHECPF